MPREVFVAGQVLTAAELNVVSDQSVMVFAGTAARGSAIPTPVEGMVTYLADSDELEVYTTSWGSIGGGKILQVVSTTKTDAFTMSSTTFADLTGLSATITPTSTSSKILVSATISGAGVTGAVAIQAKLLRDSTDIAIGDAASTRQRVSAANVNGTSDLTTMGIEYLDSPSTTSSTTYKIQVRANNPGQTVAVNRSVTDSDSSAIPRAVSTITLIEVAA